jgi:thiol-disulfide isomerase/thioredoxin
MIKKRELAFPSYAYVVSFNEARKGLEALYKAEPKDTAFQPGEGFFSFILDSEINDPWSMASGAAYYNLVGEFGSSVGRIKSYAQTHQKLVDDFGLKGNLLPDLLYSEHLAGMMSNDMRPLTPQEADSVRILIREPAIRERLMEFSREQEAKAEALRVENLSKSGYYLPRIPNVGGELILDSIVAQYPGKLVFVDFWATWCGPCKAGIQRIKPLKEEYAGKDIVFVYITDPSTPLATWTRSIPDIKGYHYRLDEKTVSVLYKKYEVKTIPRYMLFDKMGQLISGDLGNAAHNNSELKQLLEKYLQNP